MNDSVLIKTKMVTIGTDIHLLVHATACADFDNKFERKTQSTRFHQTSQANVEPDTLAKHTNTQS